jgi:hypothetical protein
MKGHRPCSGLATAALACLAALLLHGPGAFAASPAPAEAPQGVTLNAATGTYRVHRVPQRPLDAVVQSLSGWKHQVLADGSSADYSYEDGILAMECSACGLTRPSAIDIKTVDLETIVAYQAGAWHIGISSKDGSQDFYGVLRGELGPGPHDPERAREDERIALTALTDLYDLAYLAQNPQGAPPAPAAAGTQAPQGAPGTQPLKGAAGTQPAKPTAAVLADLAARGEIDAIQALKAKTAPRDLAHALEVAYGARARVQMLEGHVGDALKTLGAGRAAFGKSTTLRDREAHYVVIGDAYDRLRLAVKLDAAGLEPYLAKIRMLESADASAIQQMLAKILANRIADQRAAARKEIADELLAVGRELFPAQAEQLEKGTAGALPDDDVSIATDAAPAPATAK